MRNFMFRVLGFKWLCLGNRLTDKQSYLKPETWNMKLTKYTG